MPRRSATVPTLEAFLDLSQSEDMVIVVRSHAALEVVINNALASVVPETRSDLSRLPFMTRVDIAIAFGKVPDWMRESFVQANQLRNRFAHRLDEKVTKQDATRLLGTFTPDVWDGLMFRSYRAALKDTPARQVAFAYATMFIYCSMTAGVGGDVLGIEPKR
jgi:hypothetical protein